MPGKYELQPVLSLRERREEKRQQELQAARRRTEDAAAAVEKAKKKHQEYLENRDARINQLYEPVLFQLVKQERIDRLKEAVAEIYAEGLMLQRAVDEAERALKECREAEEKAHDEYVRATKNVTKLDEHRKIWREESAREEEREADKEQEDFTPISRIAEDDDSLD